MFYKNITFSAPEKYIDSNPELPTPAKNHLPNWFKELNHSIEIPTIKGCVPFLDGLTSGYFLKLPQDYLLKYYSEEQDKSFVQASLVACPDIIFDIKKFKINIDCAFISTHSETQVKNSNFLKKNGLKHIFKFLNPWKIKTPDGYSCLFLPPLNNEDDRFQIIPAIVDTDSYELEINFPFIINGDKYKTLETVLKKGTPFVQIIPFKRENWKLKIEKATKDFSKELDFFSKFIYKYKKLNWHKKIY